MAFYGPRIQSRITCCIELPCVLCVSFSLEQSFLVLHDLYDCPSAWVYVMSPDLSFSDRNITEMLLCSSQRIVSGAHYVDFRSFTDNVIFFHLGKVVFAPFLHGKINKGIYLKIFCGEML